MVIPSEFYIIIMPIVYYSAICLERMTKLHVLIACEKSQAECIDPNPKCYVRASRGKYRSRTFPALARAIARQWVEYIQVDLDIWRAL